MNDYLGNHRFDLIIVFVALSLVGSASKVTDADQLYWKRHTIDNSSQGADGVRLADMNGDGRLDIATGWEEGGITRVYQHPGSANVRDLWPSVTIGESPNVEDAVWFDVDGDGRLDVVSSCEGKTRQHFVHWAPTDLSQWQTANAWRSEPFRFANRDTASVDGQAPKQQWMFALPMDVDGQNGDDLVVGSKGDNASVGWLQAPKNRRDLSAWQYHRWVDAGWIMSLRAVDMDGDGDHDVLYSDRRKNSSGVRWLENVSTTVSPDQPWPVHDVGAREDEVLFLDVGRARINSPAIEIVAAVKRKGIQRFHRDNGTSHWTTEAIDWPADCGREKAVAIGDINLDGSNDIVVTAESAENASGVRWLTKETGAWRAYVIADKLGIKYDRIELIDLDEDGDLDVLTCEERDNLGVIWYENPTK